MIWPFGARRRKVGALSIRREATSDETLSPPDETPDEYEQIATALLKRAYAVSIGHQLNEDFVVLMTDAEEERLRQLPDSYRVFTIACDEAHRYGLQVESAYNFAYTFSRL